MENKQKQTQVDPKTSKTLQQELTEVFESHGIEIHSLEFESVGEGKAVWTIAGESFDGPSAYIYENGTMMYFDKEGNQIPSLEERGEEALEDFLERYPEADLYVCSIYENMKEKAEDPEDYIPPE